MATQKSKRPKRGRPPKDPKDKMRWAITARVNEADYARVCRLAKEAGLSLSQYVIRKLDL